MAELRLQLIQLEVSRCFLPSQTKALPRLVCSMTFPTPFDTGTLNGFKGAVNLWLLSLNLFLCFPCAGACGVA